MVRKWDFLKLNFKIFTSVHPDWIYKKIFFHYVEIKFIP
jgi:hypothetical protein